MIKKILFLVAVIGLTATGSFAQPSGASADKDEVTKEMLEMRAKLDQYLATQTLDNKGNGNINEKEKSRIDTLEQILQRMQQEIDALKAKIQKMETEKAPEVLNRKFENLLAVVYFEIGSSQISQADKLKLQKMALENRDKTLQLVAYTDWTGNNEVNQALSDKRALAVQTELISNGYNIDQLKSYAKGKMAEESQNLPAAECRRVEIRY